MYTSNDNKKLLENIETIKEQVENMILNKLEPTIDKRWEIVHIVRDFVIQKNRKLYGGFALNELIKQVAPNDVFYDEKNIKSWDIDFYSFDPITDAMELANILHERGYKHIKAGEALHDETYKIYVETEEFADITYVPKPIYNKIPFNPIDGMRVTGVHWLMIDYLRIMTDPLTSYFRLDKVFSRLCTLVKHFPLPHNNSVIEIEPPERDLKIAFEKIFDYMVDNKSCINVGMYAYNHLLNESKITERKLKRMRRSRSSDTKNRETQMNYVDINYFEIISTDYVNDTKSIILKLKETFTNAEHKITYQEYYPYFQFFGFSVIISFEGEAICKIYDYNNRCIPYKQVPALYFTDGKVIKNKGQINIGTFSLIMLYNLVNTMYAKTYNDHRSKNLYYTLMSHMIEMRQYYFKKNNKDIFDNTLFQEFVLTCAGNTMTAIREKQERIQKKKDAGKSSFTWNYYPENNVGKEISSNYIFANSSGNVINNERNRKIVFE
jgi:sulfur relay (sulfurtransferase) DsrC/TusE family protein